MENQVSAEIGLQPQEEEPRIKVIMLPAKEGKKLRMEQLASSLLSGLLGMQVTVEIEKI